MLCPTLLLILSLSAAQLEGPTVEVSEANNLEGVESKSNSCELNLRLTRASNWIWACQDDGRGDQAT